MGGLVRRSISPRPSVLSLRLYSEFPARRCRLFVLSAERTCQLAPALFPSAVEPTSRAQVRFAVQDNVARQSDRAPECKCYRTRKPLEFRAAGRLLLVQAIERKRLQNDQNVTSTRTLS